MQLSELYVLTDGICCLWFQSSFVMFTPMPLIIAMAVVRSELNSVWADVKVQVKLKTVLLGDLEKR